MSVLNQKTLRKAVKFEGIGLHTGEKVSTTILPSEPNTGIIFKRIDLENNNIILPNIYNVSNATLCTTITNEYGVSVSTIEHLMGALYGLGIDNALVEINSQEVPIMDGSAKVFIEKFLETGFELSEVPIKLIKITNKVSLEDGSKYISIDKSNVSLDIDFEIKYSNSLIGNQKNKINVYENNLSDIYNSRTFCLYEDVENLRKMGLAKGGSLNNAVVVKDNENSSVRDKYSKADSLFKIDSQSMIWFLQEIENERYEVIFGDGVFGKKVEEPNYIEASYIASSGAEANGMAQFAYAGRLVSNSGTSITSGVSIIYTNSPSGGGSAIDMAKGLAVLYTNDGTAISYRGFDQFKQPIPPIIAIPTTAGSGAEVTSTAVIYIDGIKHSVENDLIVPDYFFLIPEFLLGIPKYDMGSCISYIINK